VTVAPTGIPELQVLSNGTTQTCPGDATAVRLAVPVSVIAVAPVGGVKVHEIA
jgi:hypothetical protein